MTHAPGEGHFQQQATSDHRSSWARNPCLWMVIVAFALRLFFIWFTDSHHLITSNDAVLGTERLQNFRFGFETGAVAGSLASGHGFSSPFGVPTGPSAWVGPVYAGILALLFKIFGLYSGASCLAILVVNCIFS